MREIRVKSEPLKENADVVSCAVSVEIDEHSRVDVI